MPTLKPSINLDERVSFYFVPAEDESVSDAFHELTALLQEQGIETTTSRRVNPIEPEIWKLGVSAIGVGLQLMDMLLKVIDRFKKAKPTRDVTVRKGGLEIVGSADDIKTLLPVLVECEISIGRQKTSRPGRSK